MRDTGRFSYRVVNQAVGITYRRARRIVIFVIGATVGLLGVAMLVTPGPGLVVMLLGLAILATEFVWARVWLKAVRDRARWGVDKTRAMWGRRPDAPPPVGDTRGDGTETRCDQ
jgi:uncharacterized protein (TIGR02611 family)